MYGTVKQEIVNPKANNENRQRLQAVFDLKSQVDAQKETVDKCLKTCTECVSKLKEANENIQSIFEMVNNMKIEQKESVDQIYDSIEQYITSATPRPMPDVDDLKSKIHHLEKKLDELSKPDHVENKEKRRLMRPSSVSPPATRN